MTQHKADVLEESYDVVICGGGLAGLLLGLQLRRELPALRVLTLEKLKRPLPDGCHKVGESSVELGSQYLERLGLKDYLLERQIIKFGLRFFPGGGHLPLEERFEIGNAKVAHVYSYQVDRGRFENDLRAFNEENGTTLVEGCVVRDVELGSAGQPHRVSFEMLDEAEPRLRHVTARWIVDATGRHALLRKRMKLTLKSPHVASAGWYRVQGRLDINDMVPAHVRRWHDVDFAKDRWRSTNHLMGPGYWAWIIPLSTGMTSIGVVVHEELHSFDEVRSLERTQAFLRKHEPLLAKTLESYEVRDFLCLKNYSHNIGSGWSADRWALVGEAGAFTDPLYSPGTDFIALSNSFTTELIRVDLEGGDLETRTAELDVTYRAMLGVVTGLYTQAAHVYGHPRAMLTKFYWDCFIYWSSLCQYFLRGVYRLSGDELAPFIAVTQRVAELSGYMQGLLNEWAMLAPEEPKPATMIIPTQSALLTGSHHAIKDEMTPEQTLHYMRMRVHQAEEVLVEVLLRVLGELGERKAAELYARAGVARWKLHIDPSRLASGPSMGPTRDHALSPIALDVERNLGPVRRRGNEATLRMLVGDRPQHAFE